MANERFKVMGRIRCYSCGEKIKDHKGVGPCPYYAAGEITKKAIRLRKKAGLDDQPKRGVNK